MQDTLTFETLPPDEVLKRAIKFEQSKQSTQAFQKSTLGTAQAVTHSSSQIKIKLEPIMAVGNRNQNNKRSYPKDSLEASATAVIICVNYTLLCYYYVIVVKAIRWC